jgi:carbamoyltransferase
MSDLVAEVLQIAPDGVEYRLDPAFIHHGEHSWSGRYTDRLVELLGTAPRLAGEDVTDRHVSLAYAVQDALEQAVCRLVRWAVAETGIRDVCIGGGVGHNVKMNSRLLELAEVASVFAHPLCGDAGAAAGTALALCHRETGVRPAPLTELGLGPEEDDARIAATLAAAGIPFDRPADLFTTIGDDLAAGRVVGWCQGRLEAGPRALGHRSILADPRSTESRDRVNAAIKYRERWRPFGPAMLADAAAQYLGSHLDSRFMTMAFPATEALKRDAPAIVHRDGTCRVQMVYPGDDARMHPLLTAFAARTGLPVLLNTSFNIRGEPMVNTTEDALRTFFSTGLDVLVLGDLVVRKAVTGR